METTKLKRFATEARAKLRAGVATKIRSLGFDAEGNVVAGMEPTPMVGGCTWNGQILPSAFAEQWEALRRRLQAKGFNEVVEEGAYTWFNRLMAIRILSMNGIAEPVLRFVDEARTPKIVDDARQGRVIAMPEQQMQRLRKLFDDPTRLSEQFALLVTEFCHQTPILQACFGSLADYTELLLPNNILDKGGFIDMLNVADFITEEDYKSAELIGWLYQFYISDRKDEVFAKKGKVEADEIPAATQIFTPNWIVKYMAQNAILPQVRSNRLPEEDKKYLINDELPEEPKKPKDLKVADLACGSGHILNECFDLLFDLYIASGYGRADAIESIFANNLVGIDIDERARQLATFALMLKACQRDDSFADARALPQVLSMPEVNETQAEEFFRLSDISGEALKELREAFDLMKDADSLGSIMKFDISGSTRVVLQQTLEYWTKQTDKPDAVISALPAIRLILALTDSYDAIVMNPPYMGNKKMDDVLREYVNSEFELTCNDLGCVFMESAYRILAPQGKVGMINMAAWLFKPAYEGYRRTIIENKSVFDSIVYLGPGVFEELKGEVVQSVLYIQSKTKLKESIFYYLKNVNDNSLRSRLLQERRAKKFVVSSLDCFYAFPKAQFGFWIPQNVVETLKASSIGVYGRAKQGLKTGDNTRFIRNWYEVSDSRIPSKWVLLENGGLFRKWYGNTIAVLNWENDGSEIKNFKDANGKLRSRPQGLDFSFRTGLTWTTSATDNQSFRYSDSRVMFESSGSKFCLNKDCALSIHSFSAFLNSPVAQTLLEVFSPGLGISEGAVNSLPFIIPPQTINDISLENKAISKSDWDAHETSWDFQRNGIIDIDAEKAMSIINDYGDVTGICIDMAAPEPAKIEWLVSMYQMNWEAKFRRLHANEEELNRQFIEIYGLQDELTPHVDFEDITILQQGEISLYRPTHGIEHYGSVEEAAKYGEVLEDEGIVIESQSRIMWQDDVIIKQLISYMVGVWMGRYRLDRPGLNIAHPDPTEDELASYQYGPDNATLVIDDDAIIPILPTGAPFDDNLSQYISDFVRIAWGEASQTDNLNFIEKCLGKKIEDYVQKDFWKDHKKMYQNRPIYWLFSSKKGAFKALVYVHRMHPYTVEQVRTRYLLKYMDWLRSEAQRLEIRDADLTTAERRRLDRLRLDIEECEEYHERLQVIAEQAIPIDLDNGIPANHALFGDILTKLK